MNRLRTRADFLNAQKGRRRVTKSVTLESCRSPSTAKNPEFRVGFTATRKIGGAVDRNFAKRRLRAAAAATLPLLARSGYDYVLVARPDTLTCSFERLVNDLTEALRAVHNQNKAATRHAGSGDHT